MFLSSAPNDGAAPSRQAAAIMPIMALRIFYLRNHQGANRRSERARSAISNNRTLDTGDTVVLDASGQFCASVVAAYRPFGETIMARTLVSSGSSFETDIGYSRAVIDGDWIFVSGTTGFDYATMTVSDDLIVQCRQAMRNIASALSQAGASFADVVRVRYILPRREDFEPCWPVLKEYLGDVRPAATMIQAGLSDPRMKIEIEVTARRSAK